MRLWLRDSERRPDPPPATTDDRIAVAVGLALWIVALVALLVGFGALVGSGFGWWLWSAVIGIGLGVVGLVYLRFKRR